MSIEPSLFLIMFWHLFAGCNLLDCSMAPLSFSSSLSAPLSHSDDRVPMTLMATSLPSLRLIYCVVSLISGISSPSMSIRLQLFNFLFVPSPPLEHIYHINKYIVPSKQQWKSKLLALFTNLENYQYAQWIVRKKSLVN
jgi:hypothetical protein